MIRAFERNPGTSRYLVKHLDSCKNVHHCKCHHIQRRPNVKSSNGSLRSGPQFIDTSSEDECTSEAEFARLRHRQHQLRRKRSSRLSAAQSSPTLPTKPTCSSSSKQSNNSLDAIKSECSSAPVSSSSDEMSLEQFMSSVYDRPDPLHCPMQHPASAAYRIDSDGDQVFVLSSPIRVTG